MKNRNSKEWIWPPADQWITVWGMPLMAIISILGAQLFFFFSQLTGTRWISCYFAALTIAALGIGALSAAVLERVAGVDHATAFFGSMPDGAAEMAMMGERFDASTYIARFFDFSTSSGSPGACGGRLLIVRTIAS